MSQLPQHTSRYHQQISSLVIWLPGKRQPAKLTTISLVRYIELEEPQKPTEDVLCNLLLGGGRGGGCSGSEGLSL